MISLHYTSHTKAYNTIYAACNIVEAIYSFTLSKKKLLGSDRAYITSGLFLAILSNSL